MPSAWIETNVDIYGSLLGSASMIAGGVIITRLPQLAYVGFIFALAHIVHHKPLSIRKNSSDATGGPWTSFLFALLFIAIVIFQKVFILPQQVAKQQAARV